MNTGIPVIDNLVSVVLSVASSIFFLLFVLRNLSFFQKHQYAQLVVAFVIGAFIFWIIKSPESAIGLFKGLGEILNKVKG